MQAEMKISSFELTFIPLAMLMLVSCSATTAPSDSTTKSPVQANSTSLVLSDGITVTQNELDASKKYLPRLKEIDPDASPDSIEVAGNILQLGSPSEKFKNDGTMQAIMNSLGELKTDKDIISLIKINKAINQNELAKGDKKNNWLCRLTRSTIWLSSVRGSLMHNEPGSKILSAAKSALAPLDDTENRDFAGMENFQRGLK